MPRRTHDGIRKRCECSPKQWAKCAHPWHFSFHHGGREHRYSLDKVARARGLQPPSTKTDAATWRDRLRAEIRSGTFVDPDAPVIAAPSDLRPTFSDVCDQYLKRHVQSPTRRPRGRREMEILIAMLRRAEIAGPNGATVGLGEKAIQDVTKADIESVRDWRRKVQSAGSARAGIKGGEVGINRLLSRLRHLLSWAVVEGYLPETPFKRGAVTVVKMEAGAESARTRRLEPSMTMPGGETREGEESRLLRHAGPHLRALIVAALSTGCRLGELLSLQWSQIRFDEQGQPRWLVLPPTKTKTAEGRTVPISSRLKAELAMRRHAPDGAEHGPDAYVFGNECGEQVTSVRTAWEKTCKRAEIKALHFHDLRREFASRLLESRADLHDVQMFLGHAAITTTSRYLQSTPTRLERVLARLEETTDSPPPARTGADAPDTRERSVN